MFAKKFLILVLVLYTTMSQAQTPGLKYLQQTSKAFTHIANQAIPATVYLKVEQKVTTRNSCPGSDPFDSFHDEFFRRFFGGPRGQENSPQTKVSAGSGFIITADGHLLTNNHVIKDASKITVVLNDGREYEAKIVGSDPNTDLAVIKIEEKNLPTLELGDSDELNIGEWVVAIGSPYQLQASLTKGIVSAKGRQDLGITSLEDFIQTDAAINPGNSGGPLLNLKGEVVGINTAIFTQSGGYMGIGFAIPSNLAKHVAEQILQNGTVERAYLGIMMQPIEKELAEELKLENSEGILISEVVSDSPAAKSGLKQGDIIIESEGEKIKSATKFKNKISLMSPGSTVKLTVLRKNKRKDLKITLGARPEEEITSEQTLNTLGMEVDNLTPDISSKLGLHPNTQGIIITKVTPGSNAEMAGLRPYFVITGIADGWQVQPVNNTSDFNKAIKAMSDKKHLILIVRHQNLQRYYTVKIK